MSGQLTPLAKLGTTAFKVLAGFASLTNAPIQITERSKIFVYEL